MALTRHRGRDDVAVTTASEATRRDARPVSISEVKNVAEEYDSLIAEKATIEAKLAAFSQSALLKEQQRIRRETPAHLSLEAWINRKCELDEQRRSLIARKVTVEKRASAIKDAAKAKKKELKQLSRSPYDPEDEWKFRIMRATERLVVITEALAIRLGALDDK